ncbi:MAG: DUF2236 domain-containing protein [Deltaproteobacteria bacterium]|nr:DUF2236 domain-containing protein [Deltaproteobacteria bacterium]
MGGSGEVDRESFDAEASAVFRSTGDPAEGVHGPGSTTWRIARESVLFLGGGRAALLQLAHPYVAHAVAEHSETQTDPIGRFERTFRHVYAMIFGDLGHARRSSDRVRRIHETIEGTIDEHVGAFAPGDRYLANDATALLWVHATLIHTALQVYDAVVAPLSFADKDAYWRESKRFARLFGVPAADLPDSWTDFERWFASMLDSDLIAVGRPAKEIARFLLTPPRASAAPILGWYRLMTAGLMPRSLREPFGLRYTRRDALLFHSSLRTLRSTYPLLPRRLRDVPAYVEAQKRLAGDETPDQFGRTIEKLALRVVAPA